MSVSLTESIYYVASLPTPLGSMIAVSDSDDLKLLSFWDQKTLFQALDKLHDQGVKLIASDNSVIALLRQELEAYFAGDLKHFSVPLCWKANTAFQKAAWQALIDTSYGEVKSYHEQAKALNRAKSYRAVALANSQNPFALVVPCHRILRKNGALGGYAGGLWRKKWLIDHEKRCKNNFLSKKITSVG